MTKTITGLFDSYDAATAAVRALEALGIASHDISLVANRGAGTVGGETKSFETDRTEAASHGGATAVDAGRGAEIGATVGGVGGLLAGLGMIAIPGVGPVIAAGWLVSTIVGVVAGGVVGGAAGGLVGSLTHAGVPEADAHVYAEGVRRGGSLVTARVHDDQELAARSVLDRAGATDALARGETYRAEGWSRFDETTDSAGRPYEVGDLDRPGLNNPSRI
jgi:hypothetical protein